MCGDRFSSSTTCSRWRHETEPGRLDQSLSCRFWKVATHPTAANLQATNVETVVIRPRGDKDGRQVVQPLTVDVTDGTVMSNLFGASVQIFGVVATFSSDAVREIIAQGDIEVLLITGSQEEFKCNLDDTRLQRGYNP